MLNAIGLHHFRWRKKKADKFIIPPTYFRKTDYSIVESLKPKAESTVNKVEVEVTEPKIINPISDVIVSNETVKPSPTPNFPEGPKVSALSLSSIRAKKELQENSKGIVKETVHLPTESFNETDMLLYWNKYAERLGDKGHKIMESLLLISDPKLEGTTIIHELPNAGSKIDFETELNGLLGYLRGHLHNHDINIEIIVNESIEKKFAFTALDKFNRLNELNPNLELLKKTFDLDI